MTKLKTIADQYGNFADHFGVISLWRWILLVMPQYEKIHSWILQKCRIGFGKIASAKSGGARREARAGLDDCVRRTR